MLRPLKHEIPAQVAEYDDRRHDGSFIALGGRSVNRKKLQYYRSLGLC
jgi:hypothetical protein